MAIADAPNASGKSELELIDAAELALSGSPADALALADEHASRFPKGSMAEERETIAILALTKLDLRDEASAREAQFRSDHPRSAYQRRIDGALRRAP